MNTTAFSLRSIRGFILDMDGVLWKGSQAIGDLRSLFKQIDKIGWKVIFATNNATRTLQQYVEIFSSFGINVEPWQVISSATAAANYLASRFPGGGPVYIIGEEGLVDECSKHGFYQSESDTLSVIVGMDRQLTYEKLKSAALLLRSGIPFIGTNPDLTFPTPQGLVPGAGSILAALTAATDMYPIIVGKPEPMLYRIALERLKLPPEKALVIGDRPETDIAGAQLIGCHTALVLSGVTNINQANAWKPSPDIIANDLESIIKLDNQ